MLEHLGGDDHVELRVTERQMARVRPNRAQAAPGRYLTGQVHRLGHPLHVGKRVSVEVGCNHRGAATQRLEGVAAVATADVEHPRARGEPQAGEIDGQHGNGRWATAVEGQDTGAHDTVRRSGGAGLRRSHPVEDLPRQRAGWCTAHRQCTGTVVQVGGVRAPQLSNARRPRLRGWSHLLAAGPWAVGTVVLVALAGGHPARQAGLALYGVASVWLFGVSGVYHVVTWSPGRRAAWRRLDHANIFVLVAATYTPVMLTLTSRAWGISIVSVVWVLAAAGVAMSLSRVALPRGALAGLYLLLGWVSVVAMPVIAGAVGVGGLLLLLAAGALYSAGAVAYALRWPPLAPSWFGYHELFHALVIAANALFFAFMVLEVVHH